MKTYLEEIEELLEACGLRGAALEAAVALVVRFGESRYATGYMDSTHDINQGKESINE